MSAGAFARVLSGRLHPLAGKSTSGKCPMRENRVLVSSESAGPRPATSCRSRGCAFALLVTGILAGCGGGSGVGVTDPPSPPPPPPAASAARVAFRRDPNPGRGRPDRVRRNHHHWHSQRNVGPGWALCAVGPFDRIRTGPGHCTGIQSGSTIRGHSIGRKLPRHSAVARQFDV